MYTVSMLLQKHFCRLFMLSADDGSDRAFGRALDKYFGIRSKVFIGLTVPIEHVNESQTLRQIVAKSLAHFKRRDLDLLLLRVPYCDPPDKQVINTTAGNVYQKNKQVTLLNFVK